MTSISNLDKMLGALRVAAGSSAQRVAKTGPSPANPVDQREVEPAPQSSIGRAMAARILAISADDPERRRRAFRCLLEGLLQSMFGAEASAEHAFEQVVDKTQGAMESDPQLGQAIDQVGDKLLREADKARSSGDLSAFENLVALRR